MAVFQPTPTSLRMSPERRYYWCGRPRISRPLVADNPGDWMLHWHVTDHQESGMMAVIRVS
jgi:FtsP/CotA-like multicopper oxidase with cupredoxin domain